MKFTARTRLLLLILTLPVLLLIMGLLYGAGMSILEETPRGFWHSLEWAAETISTTGYGNDDEWNHPLMVIFVILVQFIGVFLVFLVFPIYLIPFLEERFEPRLPKVAPPISRHYIIYGFGSLVGSLLEELEKSGLPAVVVEDDGKQARRAMEQGHQVVFGRLEDDVLAAARLSDARALIANATDDANAAVLVSARQMGFEGEILALVEDPFHRRPMMSAGATAVYTPRHILGSALAARASERISPTVSGIQGLGRKLHVREVRIGRNSSLVGQSLAEAGFGRQIGATIIGQWVEGHLETLSTADMRLRPGGIAIVAGSLEAVERLGELGEGASVRRRQGHFVVGGFGEVGRKVVDLLRVVDEDVRVIDRSPSDEVDLVGDVLDPSLVEAAGVREAQAVILALDTDAATLFATLIVKGIAPDVPVIARVNEAENVERIHRAGADFALSLSQVSGQMLARRLLGEEAVSIDPQLKVLKVSGAGLEGKHPSSVGIRQRTGCSVVAVERRDELIVSFDERFRFESDDDVFIVGSAAATRRYLELFSKEQAG